MEVDQPEAVSLEDILNGDFSIDDIPPMNTSLVKQATNSELEDNGMCAIYYCQLLEL